MTAVFRFARDLRLEDHAGLAEAAAHGHIIPVLVLDSALGARLGASPRRAAWYCAAVASLDDALRQRGSRLLVRRGEPSQTLRDVARECAADAVIWSAGYDASALRDDRELQSFLEEAGVRAFAVHDAPAIAPEETSAARPSAGNGYRSFVPYYERWRLIEPAAPEAPLFVSFARPPLESETLPQPEEFGSTATAVAGSALAIEKLETFLGGPALQYAFALNVPADDRTSHLSAELTFGTIAARTVVRAARRRIEDPFLLAEERSSLKMFLRSIAMRDFFLQLSWYHPQAAEEPLQEKMRDFPFAADHPHFEAWREGRTGFPIVDAGVRQLHATGWMHPRVRAIAASFLCFDLGVHWNRGMAEWDRYLIEDDPALAIGNWQWVAGVGADLAAFPRIYNPRKQARRFDPGGLYARAWISELAHAPAPDGRVRPRAQIELALYSGQAYPAPVVDHERAARDFLSRYQQYVTRASDRPASR